MKASENTDYQQHLNTKNTKKDSEIMPAVAAN
jgi:hypothetical protein